MAVDVDFPARIWTNEFVVALRITGAGTGVAVAIELGLGTTGDRVGDGDATLGVGVGVWCCVRNSVSFDKPPRPPSASVASVKPPASSAKTRTPPKVAVALPTSLAPIGYNILCTKPLLQLPPQLSLAIRGQTAK